jgi:hypothetical protein
VGAYTVESSSNSSKLYNVGIAYAKVYNVVKEQFATPLKGVVLFRDQAFEGIVYADAQMKG